MTQRFGRPPKPDPPPRRPHYELREHDGYWWVYADGVLHSRKGVKPASDATAAALEAVPRLLNQEELPETLAGAAYSLYVNYLW